MLISFLIETWTQPVNVMLHLYNSDDSCCCWWWCWLCFRESLKARVKSFSTSVTDLSLAATTAVTNLNCAAECLTCFIDHLVQRTASSLSSASFDSLLLKQLQETVAVLHHLTSSLESAKTDVSKRQTRLKMPTTTHLTSDGSISQCEHDRW